MDGRYYAQGRSVFKAPLRKPSGNVSMGFRICDLADDISDEGAQMIADALNEAEDLPSD